MERGARRERAVLAMSGGVDSTAAAVLLLEMGYEVLGVTFLLGGPSDVAGDPVSDREARHVELAARAAAVLGLEHQVLDLRQEFRTQVVEPFAAEYLRGRTPNPCVDCNRRVKFTALFRVAEEAGAEMVATGHYARVRENPDGTLSLLRANDWRKDQSYVLYRLGQAELRRCLFPNGTLTKDEARSRVASKGIAVEEMRESQDICFLAGWNYRDFLALHCPECLDPGPILDTRGNLLGEHEGLAFYTVGQRRGLGVSAPRPLYVVGLDTERKAVILGEREEVPGTWLEAESASWVRGEPPGNDFHAQAAVRYNAPAVPCRVTLAGEGFTLRFAERVWAITPGQHAVIYSGEEVLGGGVIARGR
ncbi:tRNA 2-thiouridine(34) synthase MnmA [Candidatus Solincola tengchongensis]|uniref:tRNA 2-thiouridine(34) synthase MnmA n=1 Tax=Candidatus Solincola tengchongensis TaxID=2900693 RepID=UPI0025799A3F|nr:tRNA 2-thiouridine(34) synthase MnmA [Candidatus Solincola tengchongensis]